MFFWCNTLLKLGVLIGVFGMVGTSNTPTEIANEIILYEQGYFPYSYLPPPTHTCTHKMKACRNRCPRTGDICFCENKTIQKRNETDTSFLFHSTFSQKCHTMFIVIVKTRWTCRVGSGVSFGGRQGGHSPQSKILAARRVGRSQLTMWSWLLLCWHFFHVLGRRSTF